MRANSRSEILDAALRVVTAVGGADITYQSVAEEAGLTKAGLMYHFPTRDSMMIAVIEHVIERWQRELQEVLGVPLEESTLQQRVRAFAAFAGEGGVKLGEFVVFSEAVRRPELSSPWLDYLRTVVRVRGRRRHHPTDARVARRERYVGRGIDRRPSPRTRSSAPR